MNRILCAVRVNKTEVNFICRVSVGAKRIKVLSPAGYFIIKHLIEKSFHKLVFQVFHSQDAFFPFR